MGSEPFDVAHNRIGVGERVINGLGTLCYPTQKDREGGGGD